MNHARKHYARIFGGHFNKGELSLGKWGIVEEKSEYNKILLDFDTGRRTPMLSGVYVTLRALQLRAIWIRCDRTKKGWHVTIKINHRLECAEIVAIQAICRSDFKRETLNLMRVIAMRKYGASKFWKKRWNILYSGKLKEN
jgi:hypothetical protein